ncbi:MAG: alkaline phosphatase [Flexilinea sp.]
MKRILSYLFSLAVIMSLLTACSTLSAQGETLNQPQAQESASTDGKTAKYVFMFIGDGMSYAQVNSAQIYRGNNETGTVDIKELNFSQFPVSGIATTHDSTSFCPDSASTATSLSTGVKTHSGVLGLEADKVTVAKNITEMLKEQKDMKIGIVSTVTINHATPAAYYAHISSRNEYYEIAMQLAASGIDYFAGGTINQPTGSEKDKKDAFEVVKEAGYTVVQTPEEVLALDNSAEKVYAVSPELQDSGALLYSIDNKDGSLDLSDYVKKGIEVLENENGFFMMAESGKIDWAAHANDAKSVITEILEFENAIQVAIDFANVHPDETLILVTGDHETGGMTIGYAATGYDTAFNILDNQKMSYVAFDELIGVMKEQNPDLTFEEAMTVITKNFGLLPPTGEESENPLVMTEGEYKKLQDGFAESMKPAEERTETDETALLYGGYDPLSVSITHIMNNKAGIGWTSYSHTGIPVAVYAMGAGSEVFNGSYDNTDIFDKLVEVTGLAD